MDGLFEGKRGRKEEGKTHVVDVSRTRMNLGATSWSKRKSTTDERKDEFLKNRFRRLPFIASLRTSNINCDLVVAILNFGRESSNLS